MRGPTSHNLTTGSMAALGSKPGLRIGDTCFGLVRKRAEAVKLVDSGWSTI